MRLKVCIKPAMQSIRPDNGVGRVVYAQNKHLPSLGFDLVDDPREADIYAPHTQGFGHDDISVLTLHGLYWLGDLNSGEYGQYHIEANAAIIASVRRARKITVPSAWVAEPLKRDMRIQPHVIGHGIDTDEWQVGKPQGYILFGKNRSVDVCRPDAPYELAKRGLPILSTFAPSRVTIPNNMQVTGPLEEEAMHDVLSGASVYLATVKETYGIQTIEAMACGVPIVGWNYGGTADIVRNGVDGILVKPYDYDALEVAVKDVLNRRADFSTNARQNALQHDWRDVMKRYAALFERVYQEKQDEPHGVSIVITGYNYGQYIGQAIDSALNQTRKPEEVIIVDDGSTDETAQVLAGYQQRVKIITQSNQGVAAARTTGLQAASQPYVALLDADDKIAPKFIETLLPALESDRALGIAYSNMICFDDAGGLFGTEFPPDFDWEVQATPHNPPANCIPSACLFRREMWRRAGPHKQEYAPGEDAEFWTRGLSIGFTAKKVTTEKLFAYRLHPASATHTKQYKPIDDRLPWMRDKRYPLAAPSRFMPLILSYSDVRVSIIVTVTAAQVEYLPDLIDSLTGQTMREWELIVIDEAGGGAWKYHDRYPFMRYHRSLKPGNTAAARNVGLHMARADLVMFLDGSQMLTNSALEEMLAAHVNSGGRYIYSDVVKLHRNSVADLVGTGDYSQSIWLDKSLHALPALIPAIWARKVGGFFANLPVKSAEDFYSRLALGGYCGQRLGRALVIERETEQAEVKPAILKRVAKFMKRYEGVKMGSCCGGSGDAILAAKAALQGMMAAPVPEGKARLEYIWDNVGAITFMGKHREYRGGNNDLERFIDADEEDVLKLVNSGRWKQVIVTQIAQPVMTATPLPATVAEVKPVEENVLINPDFDEGFDEEAERAANEAAAKLAQPKAKRGKR